MATWWKSVSTATLKSPKYQSQRASWSSWSLTSSPSSPKCFAFGFRARDSGITWSLGFLVSLPKIPIPTQDQWYLITCETSLQRKMRTLSLATVRASLSTAVATSQTWAFSRKLKTVQTQTVSLLSLPNVRSDAPCWILNYKKRTRHIKPDAHILMET